ncbi:class III lanthionine synthetase LanKC [Streptomyces indicus]|uniref:non-specific serine/threonine protein kinase n=1 Tax=Streptomyces indicus TaxID=417292 RepID=A0A1G8YGE4_9ACTN|nr:class III lanthionine synthetase LanKC [Streptomyces indicus]SDK01717.1 Protein kinase domain-containing protein [Streptomyces indicus]
MDKRYEVFCLADRYFYETADRLTSRGGSVPLYEAARRPAPEGWRRASAGDWLHLDPGTRDRPRQGWKVHVSACLDTAEKTAAVVWDYCVPRGLPFKFVPGPHALHLRNSKYAQRGSSGKFVTVYPKDETELAVVLRDLDELLGGQPGPYILTDLRYADGPLYVRYGAFVQRHCVGADGRLVPAIENPEGALVPDRRDPVFRLPEWVTLPEFLRPHLEARDATTVSDLPYRIEKALHFSNGGGVYAGTDTRSGEQVVLKEARPYAGLAADGADAVARLERERAALERLGGLGVAPGVRDWLLVDGHRFLVMDHLPGSTLNSFFARRHPLLAVDPDPEAVARYTDWALGILRAVERALDAVHGRGLVFNDLHMFNIMVAPDERTVKLLDFEAATPVEEHRGQAIAHPGFIAPADRTGFAVDHYALACLKLALFVPMTTLLAVDRGKAAHLAEIACGQFPDLPREFLDEAVRVIEGSEGVEKVVGKSTGARGRHAEPPRRTPREPAAGDWPRSRDELAAAILASATPDREDRLHPGDIAQFADGGGLGLAHGAAGVLYALAETGCAPYEEGEQWLLRRTAPPPEGTPLGLYDGLAGVAYVLDRLGHTERALDLLGRVRAENWRRLAPDLHGGLAGLGLVLDHLASREPALRELALEAAEITAARLPAGRAGLLRGSSGPALLFLRLYESTRDPAFLDRAATALRADLARCVTDASGALVVDEGVRTMPYLGAGSIGIAAVLDDYLAHRPDGEFARARSAIAPAARLRYYAQPGLFNGRAGMVWHLARTGAPAAHLDAQIAGLDWYAMAYEGHRAFPGDQMLRLSMDLATGTAGCLLALGAARGERPASLPFLPNRRIPKGGSPAVTPLPSARTAPEPAPTGAEQARV